MGCKPITKSSDLKDLGKSPENPGKNGAQRCLTSNSGTQGLQKKHEDLFQKLHQKEVVFVIFVGEYL